MRRSSSGAHAACDFDSDIFWENSVDETDLPVRLTRVADCAAPAGSTLGEKTGGSARDVAHRICAARLMRERTVALNQMANYLESHIACLMQRHPSAHALASTAAWQDPRNASNVGNACGFIVGDLVVPASKQKNSATDRQQQ